MIGPFQNRTFRLLFAGRVITNIGDSLYFVAAMWLVYSLTGDPFYTGLAGFLTMFPQMFQFLAGPFVDRWSIRLTLVTTQLLQAAIVSLIPLAHLLGVLRVELVLMIMPILAALNQFVYPAQSTALPRILDDEDLVAANSAFAIAYQGFAMVANGVGGILIGLLGAVALFAIDAVTFVVAAIVFATVTIPSAVAAKEEANGLTRSPAESGIDDSAVAADGGVSVLEESTSYLDQLGAGANVVRGTFLMWLVIGAALVNFTAGMVMAALPPYADGLELPTVIEAIGASGTYGILMAAIAGGTLLGAILANKVATRPVGSTMIGCTSFTAGIWLVAIYADWLLITAPLILLAFIPIGIINVQFATVVQSAPPKEVVGRVSSILGSASVAMLPVGSLAGGIVAGSFGPQIAMASLAFGSTILAAYIILNPTLRRLDSPAELSI